jgi:outer membrane protein TolC
MLQSEARARWPSIRIGPMGRFEAGDSFLGGMLGIDIPFPGVLGGRIEAARERRDAALEALENELVAARARLVETREALAQALAQRDEHMNVVHSATERALNAATAEFHVDALALPDWTSALRESAASASDWIDACANVALAALDYEEARGPSPELQRSVASVMPPEASR